MQFSKVGFFIVFVLIFTHIPPVFGCDEGSRILWDFNQKLPQITQDSIKKASVCHFTKEQPNANFHFTFYKGSKVVFENKVYWEEFSRNEVLLESGKLKSSPSEESVLKSMTIPIVPSAFDRFEVVRIHDGKVVSAQKGKS